MDKNSSWVCYINASVTHIHPYLSVVSFLTSDLPYKSIDLCERRMYAHFATQNVRPINSVKVLCALKTVVGSFCDIYKPNVQRKIKKLAQNIAKSDFIFIHAFKNLLTELDTVDC
jgi:hypothetical protein